MVRKKIIYAKTGLKKTKQNKQSHLLTHELLLHIIRSRVNLETGLD